MSNVTIEIKCNQKMFWNWASYPKYKDLKWIHYCMFQDWWNNALS